MSFLETDDGVEHGPIESAVLYAASMTFGELTAFRRKMEAAVVTGKFTRKDAAIGAWLIDEMWRLREYEFDPRLEGFPLS